MAKHFLIFFFLFFSLNAQDPCDRLFSNTDQELYKKILLRAKSSKTKLTYLEKFGKCINNPGVSRFTIKGVPVAEKLQCGKVKKKRGSEFFFKDSVLCVRSVEFFPSRNVFLIKGHAEEVTVSGDWKFIKGDYELLIYDSKAQFTEGQDPEDRILKKDDLGSFTNSIGKKIHPSFIFENGQWKSISPLRELFNLKVDKDGNFSIEIITESPLPYHHDKLISNISLKAADIVTSMPSPSRYLLKGTNLKAIRIPSLSSSNSKTGSNGRYSIRLEFPGLEMKPSETYLKKNFEITVSSKDSSMSIDLIVKSKILTKDEIREIRSIIDSVTPLYHAQEKDGKY